MSLSIARRQVLSCLKVSLPSSLRNGAKEEGNTWERIDHTFFSLFPDCLKYLSSQMDWFTPTPTTPTVHCWICTEMVGRTGPVWEGSRVLRGKPGSCKVMSWESPKWRMCILQQFIAPISPLLLILSEKSWFFMSFEEVGSWIKQGRLL